MPDKAKEHADAPEEDEEKPTDKIRKHDSGAADLEKVTDYAEEKEIFSGDIKGAISVIHEKRRQEGQKKAAYEKELSKVQVTQEDVDVIAKEYELPRLKAERYLRVHKGDVVAALRALLDGEMC